MVATGRRRCAEVDPFFGNSASDPPPTEGLAATWFWPKAQTGNTHPGACSPFGWVSACAYSGAYVTGYGRNAPSYDGQPDALFDDDTALGFAHFQQSGTGAIDSYYNYLRVTPLSGDLGQLGNRRPLRDEVATPGLYRARLAGTGIGAELTVTPRTALHRYTFSRAAPATVAVDVSAGGLCVPGMETRPTAAAFTLHSSREAAGWVVIEGLRLFFALTLDAPASTWGTWTDGIPAPGQRTWEGDDLDPETFTPFGLFFTYDEAVPRRVTFRIGFSAVSVEAARSALAEVGERPFDEIAAATQDAWEGYLSRIEIEGGTPEQRQIFRSCHYFSLLKPGEADAPPWGGEGPFFFDLATLWDMTKTQLPLMMTLYPERGRDLIAALLTLAEHYGEFPNGYVMSSDVHRFDDQASCLGHVVIAEAYARGVSGIDRRRSLRLMAAALERGRGATFAREGRVHPLTHTLDLAYASYLTAQLARELGDEASFSRLRARAGWWRNAYDPATGLLRADSRYYEGTLWNYSFRLFHDVAGRIGLFASEADFVATLDRFFGFGAPPCTQVVKRPYGDLMAQGFALGRFEGLNNEPDMEVPYLYLYAGRHDRTARIVREVLTRQVHTGRGGLPGNDDSGGLTSWYVWSALGLFPVAGQGLTLIGSPLFDAATLHLPEASFRIEAPGNSERAIYVQSATLNGTPLDRAYLRPDELAAGGVLVLQMGESPSAWARHTRPPSQPEA